MNKYQEVFDIFETAKNDPRFRHFISNNNYYYDFCQALQDHNPDSSLHFDAGLTKCVFWEDGWDFVVKIPIANYYNLNYCALECRIYEIAKRNYLSSLLAWTERIGKIYNIPIYAQERVKCNVDRVISDVCSTNNVDFDTWYQEHKDKMIACKDLSCAKAIWADYCDCDDISWITLRPVFEKMWQDNLEDIEELDDLIGQYHINDLHEGNVGYRFNTNQIVLVDYSGYGNPYYELSKKRYWHD